MRTDTIFYQFFQLFPNLLGELLEDSSTNDYAFTSVEIKELARRIDGVFVPLSPNLEQRLYFVEVQFQRDDKLYGRLITESVLYLNQYSPFRLWRAVAIWAKSSLDSGVPLHYREFRASGLLRIIYLDQLPTGDSLEFNLLALVIDPPEAVQAKLNRISQQIEAINNDTVELQLVELVEKVLAYKFPNLTPEELADMFGQQELEQTRFYQELVKRGLEQGLQEGRQEGRQEGIIQGKLQTVPTLMQLGLSPEQIAEALALDLALVQQAINEAQESASQDE